MKRGSAVQAGCLACHTTGQGQPGGFIDADQSPHLLNVGCESCHGPAAGHVAEPERPYGKITLATCTSCHTPDMSPRFNFYEQRKLVRHATVEK